MNAFGYRIKVLIGMAVVCAAFIMVYCSDEVSGPTNSAPVIDSIFSDPNTVLPGADAVLSALVSDPDGDSVTYRWSTYPAAGKFSDTTSPICTLTVTTVLEGGMYLKVTLQVSDGKAEVSRDIWIPLVEGEFVQGYVYFANTLIPVRYVEVSIGPLVDTSQYGNGAYAIKHVPPGERTIQAKKVGCETCCDDYINSISVSGTDTLNHNIFMTCDELTYYVTGTVIGSVIDGDTIKLENIRVTVINPDDSETDLCDTTDQYGDFSIDDVPEGFRSWAIEDVGCPSYHVFADTAGATITNDRHIFIRVEVRHSIVISDGVLDTTGWILEDDGAWNSWVVDTLNDCFSFNTCLNGGIGKITMADSIPLPFKAKDITVTANLNLVNANCYIGYLVDGQEVKQAMVYSGTVDSVFTIDVGQENVRPAGHDFAVQFFVEKKQADACGIVCLKYFSISYTLPRY